MRYMCVLGLAALGLLSACGGEDQGEDGQEDRVITAEIYVAIVARDGDGIDGKIFNRELFDFRRGKGDPTPDGLRWVPGRDGDPGEWLLIKDISKEAIFATAVPSTNSRNTPTIALIVKETCQNDLALFTQAHLRRELAYVLDDSIMSKVTIDGVMRSETVQLYLGDVSESHRDSLLKKLTD